MKLLEKYALPALATAYFVYLCLRAYLLPITTDEAATWWNYVPDPVMDLITYKDPIPNNHLLNTLLIKFFSQFFPVHQIVIRIPALLGGAAYLIAAVGIGRLLKWSFWLQFLLFASLLGNHFVCEFLSLARGYGMSAGYLLCAVWMAMKFMENEKVATLRWAMFWAVVSVLASFTALNFFLPFCFYLLIVVFQKKLTARFYLTILSATAILGVICYLPFKRMTETNQFEFWSTVGFYKDTVLISASNFLAGEYRYKLFSGQIIAAIFITIWAIWTIAAIYRFIKKQYRFSEPGVFAWALLTGTATVTILQALIIKTPYLSGRTAVIFWPMFALAVPFLIYWFSEKWEKIARAISLLITGLVVIHFINCAQLKSCQEWWFDADAFKVLDYLKRIKDERGDGKKITLSSYWLMVNSVAFSVEYHRQDDFERMSYKTSSDPNDPSEFIYTIKGELPVYEKNFEVIWEVEQGGRYLLKRKN